MAAGAINGRSNQKLRTRQDLLRAAARVLKTGVTPTMDDVAAEALVSRATAYRYFPSIEALLIEAPLDGEVPSPDDLFTSDVSNDPAERLDRAEAALHEITYRNEAQLRLMLAQSLARDGEGDDTPARQNRRTPLIEAALAPARDRFDDATYGRLCAALALIFGAESMIVFRDVVPLSGADARDVKRWAVHALVRAALQDSQPAGRSRA